MLSYIIEGGNKLEGTVSISGSKNASLPIIAGTILSSKTTIGELDNYKQVFTDIISDRIQEKYK